MNKINLMLSTLCPNGVEYKKIEEFVDYVQPTKYIVKNTDYSDLYKTPVLTAGQTFILGYTNEEDDVYQASKENPVIIFDDFTAGYHWVDFNFKVKSSAMKMLISKNNINFRYFYHLMGMINFYSSEHTRLWIGTYSQFEIPVPPCPIQDEIVRILDNFTELTARRRQYDFYKESLFISTNCTYKKLKELTIDICDGMHNLPKTVTTPTDYPILSAANIFDNKIDFSAKRYVDEDTFYIQNKRTNIQKDDVQSIVKGISEKHNKKHQIT